MMYGLWIQTVTTPENLPLPESIGTQRTRQGLFYEYSFSDEGWSPDGSEILYRNAFVYYIAAPIHGAGIDNLSHYHWSSMGSVFAYNPTFIAIADRSGNIIKKFDIFEGADSILHYLQTNPMSFSLYGYIYDIANEIPSRPGVSAMHGLPMDRGCLITVIANRLRSFGGNQGDCFAGWILNGCPERLRNLRGEGQHVTP